jgi:hypothetical protein
MTNPTSLKSGISKTYNNHFILDEDTIRRLQGVLERAKGTLDEPTEMIISVEREDDRFYEVTNVDEVLTDPNVPVKRITALCFDLRREFLPEQHYRYWEMDWIVRVEFIRDRKHMRSIFTPTENEIRLQISSGDKNWALLLSDDIDQLLIGAQRAKSTPRWLLICFLIPIFLLLIKASVETSWAILILGIILFIFFLLFLFALKFLIGTPRWFQLLFGPISSFSWGREELEYRNFEQRRQNIMWTVIVGFILSFITSGLMLVF